MQRPLIKTRTDVSNARKFGHWVRDCLQNPNNNNGQGNGAPAQQKPFPGTTYNYMYPMIPQVPMAPVAMPSNGMQVPMQGAAQIQQQWDRCKMSGCR